MPKRIPKSFNADLRAGYHAIHRMGFSHTAMALAEMISDDEADFGHMEDQHAGVSETGYREASAGDTWGAYQACRLSGTRQLSD